MPELSLQLKGRELNRVRIQKSEFVIGREHTCDLSIDNIGVSREHAKIEYRDGKFIVVDVKSSNGTFVNGREVHEHVLADGDEIQLGKYTLVFEGVGTNDFVPTSDLSRNIDLAKDKPKDIFGTMQFSNDELKNLIHGASGEEFSVQDWKPSRETGESNQTTVIYVLVGCVVALSVLLLFALMR